MARSCAANRCPLPVALVAQDGLEQLPVPWEDIDALFLGGNDYPVRSTGAECIQVRDPNETKRVIQAITACATNAPPPLPVAAPEPRVEPPVEFLGREKVVIAAVLFAGAAWSRRRRDGELEFRHALEQVSGQGALALPRGAGDDEDRSSGGRAQ